VSKERAVTSRFPNVSIPRIMYDPDKRLGPGSIGNGRLLDKAVAEDVAGCNCGTMGALVDDS
jgi:hypothetical protein